MISITRQDIEILLDHPSQRDYVLSAYVDLRVKDGFHRYASLEQKHLARGAAAALSESEARKTLDANLAAVTRGIEQARHNARGLAVFASVSRQLYHVVELDFPVDHYLVIDEEPYILPLLERWFGQPNYLVAVVDSNHVHLFETHAGVTEEAGAIDREIDPTIQRDKPGFTYKKRFSHTHHERLQELTADGFLKYVATQIARRWQAGAFGGLILLGQSQITAAVRKLLPRHPQNAVVEEAAQTMTDRPEQVAHDVACVLERWHSSETSRLLQILDERRKNKHLIGDGPTEVLDALQQGRATQIVIGGRRDIGGARCGGCGYRFGAHMVVCVFCNAPTMATNAVQEILRLALRHKVPAHLIERNGPDPLSDHGGVSVLLRAEANWSPPGTLSDETTPDGAPTPGSAL